ncbi:efflux RND transporter permease subunit [Thioalkalivibrio sp. ALE17]|uniref:efflux RND transporter permease subunit n=1 Tax=Thioalkalivibrio sp. ALE17 TaxID=1158173 RepID=UPI00042A3662|nr:efflux RND transporter permease subunit [Thioalkalivibrio sp. ALE17]
MKALIAWAVEHARTVLLFLLLILVLGATAYQVVPKEAAPEIDIPIFFVSVPYPGVSPEDAERLMLRPLERESQTLPGVDEMQSWAGEGFALVRLDFEPGWDNRRALSDLREEVDQVRPELPAGAEDPSVSEVDLSLFPVLTLNLSGPLDERTLVRLARDLRDRVEAIPGVLEADVGGDREEQMEVLVDPLVLETFELSFDELTRAIERNNRLVAAGALDTGAGRIPLRVPGTIDDVDDVLDTAIRVEGDAVVRVRDVAEVRQSYLDPEGFTRIDGQPSVSLEIRKASEANILEVVAAARATIEAARADWPETVEVTYLQDMARDVDDLLGDLENSVIAAVLIVALVILAMMGARAALLVGVAIPGAFLGGILAIYLMGFTLNVVVLFGLILVVGMLVDGAVVVVELADRYVAEGMPRREAFRAAAQRMSWPITTAIGTTLAVFAPMLLWPGMVGEFIVYLPATVIVTLIASLAMALVFIPALGSVIGQSHPINAAQTRYVRAAEDGRYDELQGLTRAYIRLLQPLVRRPGWTLAGTLALVAAAYALYAQQGRGVEFFPQVEPDFVQVQVQARGDLSVWEADALVRQVEGRLQGVPQIQHVYARTIGTQLGRLQGDYPEDLVGLIQLELISWRERPPAAAIIEDLRERTADLPGIRLQFRAQERGPREGRPIVVEASSRQADRIAPVIREIRSAMDELGGFEDVTDDLPLPGVELEVRFDREQAARFGADVPLLGEGVQLLTRGIQLGSYRPDYSDEEVDIRLRLPAEQRHLQQLATLNLPGATGLVPLAHFAELVPVPATGLIKRRDGDRAYSLEADAASGYLVDERQRALEARIAGMDLDPEVQLRFRGQAEEQAEAARFLLAAFALSLFLMLAMMVTQFNRFSQALLVMSAIVFSTAGVLLALLLRGEPFGIVMSGIGVLALAGIVVNNNIVLIDTYNEQRGRGLDALEAALRAAAQRMRPVLLTAITTILGLMPMVLAWTVDFAGRDFYVGAPVTGFWVQLATAIAGGLFIATPLTLLFTPAMLVLLDRLGLDRQPAPAEQSATGSPGA